MFFGYSAFAQNTGKHLSNYLAVKNALVSSDSKAAARAAVIFQQGLKEDQNFAQKNDLLKATDLISQAGSIDKQRAAFNDLSKIIWKVLKSSDKAGEPVYYQYCPMKKAYWLSKEKEIKNPYYGAAMLTCGSVVETQ